jgi:D-erythrulose 1-phosphate 3-epimerase
MQLGINLSFCVKRWVTPQLWAPLVREQLGLDCVQFSFDLVDPMWSDALLDELAAELREVPQAHGVSIHSAAIGLAHYTYNQLLHPNPRVRLEAERWLTRAYRFAAHAGITKVGGPLGAVASRLDGVEPDAIADTEYRDLIARMHRLAEVAAREGMTELHVEATPMRREWPWTIDQAAQMMADTASSAVPWKLCIDWGHGSFEPIYGRYRSRMEPWLQRLAPHIAVLQIQQTDGQYDRHWDFSEKGVVDPVQAANAVRSSGLADRPVFLEVFYPFERDDASILAALHRSMQLLQPAFADAQA